MLSLRKSCGFSLIELMVAIAIIAVLLGIAVPSFSVFVENSKIRGVATSFQTGIQLARTKAVVLNLPVNFTPAGTSWTVAIQNAALCPIAGLPDCPTIESYVAQGGGMGTVQIAGSGTVSFNGLGQNTTGAASITFGSASGTCVASSGDMRCLNVMVSAGGQSRICDPSVGTGDTRHC